MTNAENSPSASSPLRRWWSVAIGVAVFILILVVYETVLTSWLGGEMMSTPSSGLALITALGGLIGGFLGASAGQLVARDMDKKMFLYSATAALVVVIRIGGSRAGFDGATLLQAVTLLIGGFVGLRAGSR